MLKYAFWSLLLLTSALARAENCPALAGQYATSTGQTLEIQNHEQHFQFIDDGEGQLSVDLGAYHPEDGFDREARCDRGQLLVRETLSYELDTDADDFAYTADPSANARVAVFVRQARQAQQSVTVEQVETDAWIPTAQGLTATDHLEMKFTNARTGATIRVADQADTQYRRAHVNE